MATKKEYTRQFKCTWCGCGTSCTVTMKSETDDIAGPEECPYSGCVDWKEVVQEEIEE